MQQLPTVDITGPYQTRGREWTPDLIAFGDALESVLAGGVHDLAGIVAGLNACGSTTPAGAAWSEAALRSRLADLGE